MNKTVIAAVVSVLAIIIIGGVVLVTQNNSKDTVDHSQMSDSEHEAMMQSDENASSNQTQSSANTEVAQTTKVEIKGYAYSPAKISIKKGTTITWTNQDSVRHDVMPDGSSDAFKASELLAKGKSYSFTFNTVGIYSYHCSPHTYMKGTVEVTE